MVIFFASGFRMKRLSFDANVMLKKTTQARGVEAEHAGRRGHSPDAAGGVHDDARRVVGEKLDGAVARERVAADGGWDGDGVAPEDIGVCGK